MNLHVIASSDHTATDECDCDPHIYYEDERNGGKLWYHQRSGEPMPHPSLIAQAIMRILQDSKKVD